MLVVVFAPPREKGDLAAESVPADGILNKDEVWVPWPPAVEGAAPKSGLEELSAVVAGVVDSAGLSLLPLPNKPPPVDAAGVDPNRVLCCVLVPDPKSPPPVDGVWEAPPNGDEAAGAVEAGVADEVVAVFIFPKRPPVFGAACPNRD